MVCLLSKEILATSICISSKCCHFQEKVSDTSPIVKEETPSKPRIDSKPQIRVRNPPGGQSSGAFWWPSWLLVNTLNFSGASTILNPFLLKFLCVHPYQLNQLMGVHPSPVFAINRVEKNWDSFHRYTSWGSTTVWLTWIQAIRNSGSMWIILFHMLADASANWFLNIFNLILTLLNQQCWCSAPECLWSCGSCVFQDITSNHPFGIPQSCCRIKRLMSDSGKGSVADRQELWWKVRFSCTQELELDKVITVATH